MFPLNSVVLTKFRTAILIQYAGLIAVGLRGKDSSVISDDRHHFF